MKGLTKDEIKSRIFYAEVIDSDDPEYDGRCKVKVFGVLDQIPDESLPWAHPGGFTIFSGDGGGDISIPKKGSIVRVRFPSGDIYSPEWFSMPYLNEKLKNEIKKSYLGSQVILYDEIEDVKIYYTPSIGLQLWYGGSKFLINPDKSITIEHNGIESIIEFLGTTINITTQNEIKLAAPNLIEETATNVILNGKKLTQLGPSGNMSAVGSEPLFAFLKALASAVDNKWPATPGVLSSLAEAAEVASTSKIVKVTV